MEAAKGKEADWAEIEDHVKLAGPGMDRAAGEEREPAELDLGFF